MNLTQYLLGKLAEEAAEVAQMALKCQQFGMTDNFTGETNSDRLTGEIRDFLVILRLLQKIEAYTYLTPESKKPDYVKIIEWAQVSADMGLLNRTAVDQLKAKFYPNKSGEE